MRARLRMLVSTIAFLTLSGCERGASIQVHNGTGARLDLQPSYFSNHVTPVMPNQATPEIHVGLTPEIGLTSGACERRYALPPMGINYPWEVYEGQTTRRLASYYSYPLDLQVGPDHSVYLLPPGARSMMPLEVLKDRQTHGYPLRPMSETCR